MWGSLWWHCLLSILLWNMSVPAVIPPALSAARWGRGSWPFGMWRWAPGVLAGDSIKQTTQQGKLVWKLIRTNKTWLEGNENNFLSCLDHWNAAVPRNPGDAVRMLGSGNIADKYTLALETFLRMLWFPFPLRGSRFHYVVPSSLLRESF